MTISKPCATVLFVAVVITVSATSWASDEEQSVEEVAQVFIQILSSIESEFDCLLKVISIRRVPASTSSAEHYYAEFRASGIECGDASEMLRRRGQSEGIVFFRRNKPYKPDTAGKEPILDLIYQVDPPVPD